MLRIDHQTNESIKRVRNELANHLKKNEGLTLENLEIVNIAKRSFSTIVFLNANTSKGTQRMVMKKVVHDPINLAITKKENQAVVEFEILKKLYPQFKEVEGCAVPRPILVIPEMEAFVMDYVEGRLLSEELKYARYFSPPSKFEKLQRYYYLCGRWLCYFQKFTGFEYAGVEAFDDLIDRCKVRLDEIAKIRTCDSTKEIRNQTLDFLNQQLEGIKKGDVIISGRHGDFGHWNILINQDIVIVFDLMGYAKEPIIYDVLKILNSIEYWKNHPAYSNSKLEVLRNKFLAGFGYLPQLASPVVIICEMYYIVNTIYACLYNPGKRIDERLMRIQVLRKNLKYLRKIQNGTSSGLGLSET